MKIAFVLYKYFPFGGVQRDCLHIAQVIRSRGHEVELLCIEWNGDEPPGIPVHRFTVAGFTNHRRYRNFAKKIQRHCQRHGIEGLVGFNKMPGLDVYFAADGCYQLKSAAKSRLYRMTPRYQYFLADEQSVFAVSAKTHILVLVKREQENYQRAYETPNERFTLLPPGITEDRKAPVNSAEVRSSCRAELGVNDNEILLLMVGSGFKTKGLDRALLAIKSLPDELLQRIRFVVIGKDNFEPFRQLSGRLGLTEKLIFFPGRDDIPRFLQGADLLMHPAYYENSGMILLEALVAGLPVLTTDACGYAHYVEEVGCGLVISHPYRQDVLDKMLAKMLTDQEYDQRRRNGIEFGNSADLYQLHEVAADAIERVVDQNISKRQIG